MSLPMWTFWIALVAMIIGLLGVFLPVVPDLVLIWLVILAYAVADGFTAVNPIIFIVLTILAALGFSAEFWMSQAGAKASGASNWSLLIGIVLGAVGAAVGFIFFGIGAVPGALLGALAGLVAAEWCRWRDWHKALRVVGGWLIGYFLSVGVQLSVGVAMILIFAWSVLSG